MIALCGSVIILMNKLIPVGTAFAWVASGSAFKWKRQSGRAEMCTLDARRVANETQ